MRGGQHGLGSAVDLRAVGAADLHEHPAVTGGQARHRAHALLGLDDAHEPAVQALAGGGGETQDGHGVVGGTIHRGVAEGDERANGGIGHQANGGLGDRHQSAFGAGEEARHIEPVLGQQVLQAVTRDLAPELAELGADRLQVGADEFLERRQGGRILDAGRRVSTEHQLLAPAGDASQAEHVVGGLAVAQGARAAGVVADHAADRAAVERGGIGAELQAEGGRSSAQIGLDDAGLHDGGPRLRVDGVDGVEVARYVDDHAWSDGIARARGAAAARGDGGATQPRVGQQGAKLFDRARLGHGQRHDAIDRGVGGIQCPAQGGGVEQIVMARRRKPIGQSRQRGRSVGVGDVGTGRHRAGESSIMVVGSCG